MKKQIIFFHGFGGKDSDWNSVISFLPYTAHSLLLPGHASAPSLEDLNIHTPMDMGKYLAEKITRLVSGKVYLCGYSMGGRLATLTAEHLPMVLGLGLISSGAGENTQRQLSDQRWANLLRKNKARFWKEWLGQTLFSSLRRDAQLSERWLEERMCHDPQSLAQVLEKLSPSAHPSLLKYWHKHQDLLYIVGEQDKKYCRLLDRVEATLPLATTRIVPGASHNILMERPQDLAQILQNWIEETEHGKKNTSSGYPLEKRQRL